MAFVTRAISDEMSFALVAALNELQAEKAAAGSDFHADITSRSTSADYKNPSATADTVTAANASDLPTLLTLANQEQTVINRHFADTLAHDTAVSAALTSPVATDLTTAQTMLNAIKAAYNTHLSEASVHYNNDATNTIIAANATNQATAETLANEIKTDSNAHLIGAVPGQGITLVTP